MLENFSWINRVGTVGNAQRIVFLPGARTKRRNAGSRKPEVEETVEKHRGKWLFDSLLQHLHLLFFSSILLDWIPTHLMAHRGAGAHRRGVVSGPTQSRSDPFHDVIKESLFRVLKSGPAWEQRERHVSSATLWKGAWSRRRGPRQQPVTTTVFIHSLVAFIHSFIRLRKSFLLSLICLWRASNWVCCSHRPPLLHWRSLHHPQKSFEKKINYDGIVYQLTLKFN